MKLNPLDIYNKEFKKSTFGYNTTQVDDFLDEIGIAYERALKDLNSLDEENRDLKEKIDSFEAMEDKLQSTLDSIQATVSKKVEQADNEARLIIKEARIKGQRIIEDAHEQLSSEKRKLELLREQRNFFKIRFQTLLESHLEMLEDADEERLRENNDLNSEFDENNDQDHSDYKDFE